MYPAHIAHRRAHKTQVSRKTKERAPRDFRFCARSPYCTRFIAHFSVLASRSTRHKGDKTDYRPWKTRGTFLLDVHPRSAFGSALAAPADIITSSAS